MKDQKLDFVMKGLRELESIAGSNHEDRKLRVKSKMIAILGEALNIDGTFWSVEKGKLKREIFFNRGMTDSELDQAYESLPSMPINTNSIVGYFSLPPASKQAKSLSIPINVQPILLEPNIEGWGFSSFEELPGRIVKKTREFSKRYNYLPGSMYLMGYRLKQNEYPIYVVHFIKPSGLDFNEEEKTVIEIFFRYAIQLIKNIESSEGEKKNEKKEEKPKSKPEPAAGRDEMAREMRNELRDFDRRLSKDHAAQLDLEERLERLEERIKRLDTHK
jgi:hypothetical protein